MHTLVAQTKYTFGDRVRFHSPAQQRSGTGTVVAVTVWGPDTGEDPTDYTVKVDGEPDLQAGIIEDEMTLLEVDGS